MFAQLMNRAMAGAWRAWVNRWLESKRLTVGRCRLKVPGTQVESAWNPS